MEANNEFNNQAPPHTSRKLYKSSANRRIEGVCAGIAEYIGIKPIWIRLIWVILTLDTGFFPGIIAYIIATAIIPRNPNTDAVKEDTSLYQDFSGPLVAVLGGGLILLGVYYLLRNFNLIPYQLLHMTIYYISNAFFPVLLIVLGMFIILYRGKK